ncbi:tyrosine-type recombinase/integrase [Nostoc sp. FACHB-87]|uniref:site-specific integrase n=1 Tax=Nostocales TaxID=1161 RepID=UPI00168838F3|nr:MULTISPECIES: tyrosine-type recombinase/integrase [Nostocales]MBD2299103.1 tyrosine-type recombinase/integrase [Nostoc sp. FACHB-190]MBD2456791.1 tyrosine-type recombinase/integrase [Nostoc sp. FACHB-87]MBD2476440.1 tyrosine-type recombinase/integrase [Anabaena sp. FACHB-83]MBD2488383.1 tyrosine-type recombinase/integrase [Aulosira sp. FACHB-615]
MVNSSTTPTGKTKKGQIVVREDSGSIKACFPRNYFADGKQVKKGTGISNVEGWEAKADKLQRRLQLELEKGKLDDGNGNFNEVRYQAILKEYGLQARLRLVDGGIKTSDELPPKPELSLLEVWDRYLEYIKLGMKESHFVNMYCHQYSSFIKSAIEATKSEDAIKIRNWLVENRSLNRVKILLSNLSKAYQLAIKNKSVSFNPYDGLADDIKVLGAKGKKQTEVNTETDDDVLDKSKAYTWHDVQTILEAFKNHPKKFHWHDFTKFKFLTGCRTGEAIAFLWCDINWEKECVYIRRTYDRVTKKFYHTKTSKGDKELIRIFPMPKDGELWNLIKSIPQGEANETVFKTKTKKIIRGNIFTSEHWKPVIDKLIEQGKLTKYLSPYNTRHTFITHQIFDLGRDEKIVSAWCGHGEAVSQKHYQDITDRAILINPELPASPQTQQLSKIEQLEEQLRQQQELIDKLLAEKGK